MTLVYLGLGSNLGDRATNLWEAVRRVRELSETRIVALSKIYETEPIGPVEQGWFLNAVVGVDTAIEPTELLAAVKRIEGEMGRVPSERWGPRLIDIDILLYGDLQLSNGELTVPHPEMWNRRFVLIPLLDVLPENDLSRQVQERLAGLLEDDGAVRPHPNVLPEGEGAVRREGDRG